MVEYKSSDQYRVFRPGNYWKLDCFVLREGSYFIADSNDDVRDEDDRRATEKARRKERNLLDYQKCTEAELRTFFEQRELIEADENDVERSELVALLENADDEQTFDHFLSLPLELRVLVYDFHLAWLQEKNGGSLTSPKPPPISTSCKQLRQETLELFHVSVTFRLRANTSNIFQDPTWKFYVDAPEAHVAMVQHITLLCGHLGSFDLNLGSKMTLATVKHCHDEGGLISASKHIQLEKRIGGWITLNQSVPGTVKLSRSNVRNLLKLAEFGMYG